ncbi:MAG: cytochrome c3 family protein [Candidatus Methylomirabilales bacterium]
MKGLWIAAITAALLAVVAVGIFVTASGRQAGPEQPIAFSHKTHAGDNKIPCLYCHVYARRSTVAGIPSVQRCMGCHKITAADKPEVKKLKGYWDRKEPIRWRKVTWMPDFVWFEHWPHVQAGLDCENCHGPVETMERMQQVKTLTMGECVVCHRERGASIDCVICHR